MNEDHIKAIRQTEAIIRQAADSLKDLQRIATELVLQDVTCEAKKQAILQVMNEVIANASPANIADLQAKIEQIKAQPDA
jgi:hypothetical protein